MVVRNFWSLQVGEAIFSDMVKTKLPNNYQMFFPLNSQLRGIDLLLFNLESNETATIQVKESREFSAGHGWFIVKAADVDRKAADFYAFIVYNEIEKEHKHHIDKRVLIVPSAELQIRSRSKKLVKVKKTPEYHYYFFIDGKSAFDDREGHKVDFSLFLENFEQLKI